MALRTIRIQGDPVLTKVCRPIPEVTDRIRTLAEDMLETMYEANGVGLAAPQVGILKRMVVIDIGDGQGPFIMINPEIIESDGEQTGDEENRLMFHILIAKHHKRKRGWCPRRRLPHPLAASSFGAAPIHAK